MCEPRVSPEEQIYHENLSIYYDKLFPCQLIYRWLSYSNPALFSKREFAFILPEEVYHRYESVKTAEELKTKLLEKVPVNINIGAIYDKKPDRHKLGKPIKKELVFDLDISDYDDVRTCCSGADICRKCWKFIVIACEIMDEALRNDFKFESVLWVFSGRRGVHCWVCDETARDMEEDMRCAVMDYLNLLEGGVNQRKKVRLEGDKKVYPSIRNALKHISKRFLNDIVINQDILGTDDRLKQFLLLIDDNLLCHFESPMKAVGSSEERWKVFEEIFADLLSKDEIPSVSKYLVEEMRLQYAYLRLDLNVTKDLGHLLKSPFVVHPGTKKIAVPFDSKFVENFDPETVPDLSSVVNQLLNSPDFVEEGGVVRIFEEDYEKTSLVDAIKVFKEFVNKCEKPSFVVY